MKCQILEKNGYKCLYKQKEGVVSTVRIIVDAGSIAEDKSVYGVAHFVEHMFFKGCQNKNSKEIRDLMGLYGDSNAYTDFARTVYYLSCLKTDVYNSLNLIAEILFQPKYEQEEMDKEANVITEEIQTRLDNPNCYFFDNAMQHLIPGYGHCITGSKDSVLGLNISDLEKFTSDHYLRDNICFAIVSSIPAEDIQIMFDEIIDKWSSGHNAGNSMKIKYSPNFSTEIKKMQHNSEQAVISAVYKGLSIDQKIERNYVNRVFHNAFGGNLHSILFDRVREKLGLCYNVSSFDHRVGEENRTFFYATLKKENVDQALSEIEKCFKEIQKNGIDDDLLRIAKKNLILDVASSTQTADSYARQFMDLYFDYGLESYEENAAKIMLIENKDIIEFARWLNSSAKQLLMMNVD